MLRPLFTALLLLSIASPCVAQLERGFAKSVEAYGTIQELVRQPDLWIMEVQFKPMRMVYVDVRDPKTGTVQKEQVWYLVYRCINRPLNSRPDDDVAPVNELDPLPGPRMFTPQFTLITYDNPKSEVPVEIRLDEVVPEAMPAILKVERMKLLNAVEVYQEVPAPVAADAEQQPWIYGVAMWRSIDPETDFFKVIAKGFSNGYELRPGTDGQQAAWRRVIIQKFSRPGDRFDPNQGEFEFDGNPTWVMQPDGM